MSGSTVGEQPMPTDVVEWTAEHLDGIVLAAGFEQRARKVLEECSFRPGSDCVLIRFINNVPDNDAVFASYLGLAQRHFAEERIHVVEMRQGQPERFEADLARVVASLARSVQRFGIDVSGMPAYVICMSMKVLRTNRGESPLTVLYTAAVEYNPTRAEYLDLMEEEGDAIELLPHSMALEMGSTLILDSFSGYRSQNARSCLAILAGYEAHRSTGVVEAVNPTLLIIVYGLPGDPSLAWRLDLSQRLHRKFEYSRRAATEIVSTLDYREVIGTLERYYHHLMDDYDLVIAPIGSKMETLAAYLFWERYPEIQLNFPLPIGYDPSRSPVGMGTTYVTVLPPKRTLFRSRDG